MIAALYVAYIAALLFVALFIVANVFDLMCWADSIWATVDHRCLQ